MSIIKFTSKNPTYQIKDGKGKPLAKDLILETVMIQGDPIGDYFQLIEENN